MFHSIILYNYCYFRSMQYPPSITRDAETSTTQEMHKLSSGRNRNTTVRSRCTSAPEARLNYYRSHCHDTRDNFADKRVILRRFKQRDSKILILIESNNNNNKSCTTLYTFFGFHKTTQTINKYVHWEKTKPARIIKFDFKFSVVVIRHQYEVLPLCGSESMNNNKKV